MVVFVRPTKTFLPGDLLLSVSPLTSDPATSFVGEVEISSSTRTSTPQGPRF